MFNQSDESVLERWVENPYWQYFCEEVYFFHDYPFDHAELIKFRRRIGEKGAEQILKATVNLFEKEEVQEKEVLKDTTVQEKNIKEQVLQPSPATGQLYCQGERPQEIRVWQQSFDYKNPEVGDNYWCNEF